MAKLTAGARKRLPAQDFAGPGRSFPVPDKSHARAALQGVPKAIKAGNLTPAQGAKVRAKAKAKLGKPMSTKPGGLMNPYPKP